MSRPSRQLRLAAHLGVQRGGQPNMTGSILFFLVFFLLYFSNLIIFKRNEHFPNLNCFKIEHFLNLNNFQNVNILNFRKISKPSHLLNLNYF